MKVGFGYDIHPLVKGRLLILGGVRIAHEKGLDGHSDADVLCHAVSDALLGAALLGDIGEHFPDNDPAYKDISSVKLLEAVGGMIRDKNLRIVYVDATVVAERPKVLPYRSAMRKNLAEALGISMEQVSIKAKTNEGFGAAGREEAIVTYAVATVDEGDPVT